MPEVPLVEISTPIVIETASSPSPARTAPNASIFDEEKFASILKEEVEDIANSIYRGSSKNNLSKAFVFWCIKNISWSIKDRKEIELARSICEADGAGDEHIDGAWIDKEKNTLFIIQAKYSEPEIPKDESDFKPLKFSSGAAEELDQGFSRLYKFFSEQTHPGGASTKLLTLEKFYRQARDEHLKIRLVIAISGEPKASLYDKINELNDQFENDRSHYANHHYEIYGLGRLNQIVSNNWATPPGVVYISNKEKFVMKNPDDSAYAIACNVDARELVKVREKEGYNIYHSNFRFLLKRRKAVARPKMERTLDDPGERTNFWRYNNGITVTCQAVNAQTPLQLEIKRFQVVNGLQTIETLFENRMKESWLKGVDVLVRIIPTADGAAELEEHIAEYSNSQTPITPRDLRSNDSIQVEIERILSEVYDLTYIRKKGEFPGLRGRPGRDRVDNERAAQAALAFWHGLSHESKSNARLIFEKSNSGGYYDRIFGDKTAPQYILLPYLFYRDLLSRIWDVEDNKQLFGAYRILDTLALTVVGDACKSVWKLGANPSRVPRVLGILKPATEALMKMKDSKSKTLWAPVLKTLYSEAEKRRRVKATRDNVELDDIPLRNVIVSMRWNADPKLRKIISSKPAIKQVRKILGSLNSH